MQTESNATQKRSLYNPYRMAIRWASDRIGKQGLVAFVTSGTWIDGKADSGLRACLADEFSAVYVLNLRGDQRTQGERSRREGGKIFGQGSREPVAITILVRNPNARHKHKGCQILYRDVGDYLTKAQKLTFLRTRGSVAGIADWEEISPDRNHDWISLRSVAFERFLPMGIKGAERGPADDRLFEKFSNGYKTGRDPYVYNFDRAACTDNARRMLRDYTEALQELDSQPGRSVKEVTQHHSAWFHWDSKAQKQVGRSLEAVYSDRHVRPAVYRPFVKSFLYADDTFAQRPGLTAELFPVGESNNWAIGVTGERSKMPFSTLVVDAMPDLELISKGRWFPRWRFEEVGGRDVQGALLEVPEHVRRVDNVTDVALARFRDQYGDPSITRDEIFLYVYGVLHQPEYREGFANDLLKSIPRVPFASDFREFSESGRQLVELHLGYESCEEYPLELEFSGGGDLVPDQFGITSRKMRLIDSTPRVNERISLHGIPAEAHEYVVNGRTPLEWLIDRYYVRRDKRSGIVNDPNGWFEAPRDLITVIRRIVHMSVETVRIVRGLPGLDL